MRSGTREVINSRFLDTDSGDRRRSRSLSAQMVLACRSATTWGERRGLDADVCATHKAASNWASLDMASSVRRRVTGTDVCHGYGASVVVYDLLVLVLVFVVVSFQPPVSW